ncbi:MAG TPA: spore germination protein GerW family protein [Polyangiaceae bacterium]|nr:spore germination protein GerW family protein [Polyangiaceae bacterium]
MSESKIAEVVESLLKGVQGISKSETIIGAAQQAGDATVIPVHRLKIAFGAASANAGARGSKLGGDSGGYGAGGAVELEPVAAIAIAKDGTAHLLTVEGDEKAGWSALLQEVPDIVSRLANAVSERVRLELSSRGAQTAQIAEPAVEHNAELPGKKS